MAKLRRVEVRRPEALAPHEPAWEELARDAVELNVFYEPWLLRPAWDNFGGDGVRVLLLYDDSGGVPRLCGLFPLKRSTGPLGLKLVELWQYNHCFLCTPLVRPGWEDASWRSVLAWVRGGPAGGWFWRLYTFPAQGRLWETLRETLVTLGRKWAVQHVLERPFLSWSPEEADGALSLSVERRKKLRRQENQLRALGEFSYRELGPGDDTGPWLQAFLDLECSGWKGGEGGYALAKDPRTRAFFAAACQAAHRRGRLRILGAYVGDRPIAMLCDFLSGAGTFYFKSAYDEDFAQYSPGTHLEVENLRRLLRDPVRGWVDSCHDTENGALKKLLVQTRVLHDILIASGTGLSGLIASMWPLLHQGKRQLSRVRQVLPRLASRGHTK